MAGIEGVGVAEVVDVLDVELRVEDRELERLTLEELSVLDTEELETEATGTKYIFIPYEPPQISLLLPAHALLQRPSVAIVAVVAMVLPQ